MAKALASPAAPTGREVPHGSACIHFSKLTLNSFPPSKNLQLFDCKTLAGFDDGASSPIIESHNSFGICGLIISMIPPGGDLMTFENWRLIVGCAESAFESLTPFQRRDILSYVAQELSTEN